LPNFTPIGATCRPCGAKKPQNRPLSKLNTGRLALGAMLPVTKIKLECGPMPNVMVALPNVGGDLCSTQQSLDDAQYWSAVQ